MFDSSVLPRATVDFRVPFFDIDSMHIAWHGHYAKYFELARCALLEAIGHGYQAMFDAGHAWPIVDLRIRYLRPLRYNQHVQVDATLKRWDHQLKIAYRIRDYAHGTSLARGFTLQAVIDRQTGTRLNTQPAAVAAALSRAGLITSGDRSP
jgi:acyl-CoA thioester hydrolase